MVRGAAVRVTSITNTGLVRQDNQDRYLIDEMRGLFVVCDGMGGHKAGDVAAQLAIDTLNEDFQPDDNETPCDCLVRCIKDANQRIFMKAKESKEYSDMGTTITAAVIRGMSLDIASIGDSSLFIIDGDQVQKVTEDHTLAQQLYHEGFLRAEQLSKYQYRHVLTRALGIEEEVEVDCYSRELSPGNQVIITTDGLTDMVSPDEIPKIISNITEPADAAAVLMQTALDRGGFDNITIILISL